MTTWLYKIEADKMPH